MRDCPICSRTTRTDMGHYQNGFNLYECSCGFRYLDAQGRSQESLDSYYGTDTSPDLQGVPSMKRLMKLIRFLPDGRGLDIGGKWSPLKEVLDVETLNAGEKMSGEYDYVVMSHTLEHVYNVTDLMAEIDEHLKEDGRLIIEGPIWLDYERPGYDFYWQHLNKFTPDSLARLLKRWVYHIEISAQIEDFLDFQCWRIVGTKL